MKFNIDDLVIEITRQCNMSCSHCVRGPQQNKIIKTEYLETLFASVEHIGVLTISGGEPSLHPKKIIEIISIAKKHNVYIDNFYIVTNGKNITSEFLMACIELYVYCGDNEITAVEMSQDNYHEPIYDDDCNKLTALSFFRIRDNLSSLINQGNAEINGIGNHENRLENFIINDEYIQEGIVYLNCNGDLIAGCDWSYENQEHHVICHVDNITVEAFNSYVSIEN